MYDIWTFTDASVAVNQYTRKYTGVYGFVHMCVDGKSGTIKPFDSGFKTAPVTDNNALECFALWLALTDIESKNYSGKIGIFTDSDHTYNNITAISKGILPRWYNNPRSDFEEYAIYVASVYSQMIGSFNLSMNLIKSHVREWGDQIRYFKSRGININALYAKNVCIGNAFADYYVSTIAKCQSIPTLQPYNKELPQW